MKAKTAEEILTMIEKLNLADEAGILKLDQEVFLFKHKNSITEVRMEGRTVSYTPGRFDDEGEGVTFDVDLSPEQIPPYCTSEKFAEEWLYQEPWTPTREISRAEGGFMAYGLNESAEALFRAPRLPKKSLPTMALIMLHMGIQTIEHNRKKAKESDSESGS